MTGRYKAYPEYKNSEIHWLGDVPIHWDICRVKNIATVNPSKSEVRGRPADAQVSFIPMEAIGEKGELDTSRVKNLSDVLTGYTYVSDGDIMIAKITPCFENGKGAIAKNLVNGIGFATTEVIPIRPNQPKYANFLFYVLNCNPFKFLAESSMYGAGGQKRVADSFVAEYHLSLPSESEQVKIVSFLDHETAKIDTLIEKQQQLTQLLKEKRQAVISHVVTKGLNANAKMRDSGIGWLGEVPEHWEVSKFGYISMVIRGGSPRPAGDPALFNGDYSPWVTVAEITKNDEVYLTQTETSLTKKGSDQCRIFSSGTLLISNSGATLGVPKILSINANANDGVVGFENLKLDHEFSYFYLSTLTADIRERIKQGSGQPNLNTDIVKNIAVPIPPKNEISEIVALIRNTRKQYANLMARANAGIELLQERRTALISATVTGKIDVRNWNAPQASQTNKEVAA
jgi:type I restriction enzyme S subunit